ncbi:aerobic-type carbon monoxide dehydrogenase, middle subunit CoxM/CutM-like protein [Desulfosporosinus orientis DSM 765]|uniref:Aerobic-type carbon monoxide dehydrogenase, middle subunit CoxM/CutM-like protein n=1 Tax=Desulfosporosinus orientis (strain ATCC 19365 / DSM 765 / NCIMB 8382 / VKM B-1628 / Singapore I) TaxID=768706 RepID=G7W5T2_DESOD|nr:xanthine dehydrogenase FAD-binding subunit XdhB [Desulfosporosinus orientis]AET67020.1 aerobic-type carbon monoxide dehydrogenase, middle subunit CoxM/CutM-like protein [Desulfosporosinus orientis DSM 765]
MYDIKGYYDAETVSEAAALLAEKPQLKLIAGGTDVLIKMHGGQWEGVELLSLRKIKSMEEIRIEDDGTIIIGAMATFSKIYHNPILKEEIPIITEAAVSMGGPQIRNMATIGGNVCNGVTSADSASSLFALNAQLKLVSKSGERIVPIREFYLGPGKVALNSGEILTELRIAREDYQGFGGQYIKFAMREAMDIATLGVAVVCKVQNKYFEEVRIGLGVAGPTPLRCLEAEEFARGKEISSETLAEIGKLAIKSTKARTSWRASKEYREHLVEELTQRALRVAVVNAGGVEVV